MSIVSPIHIVVYLARRLQHRSNWFSFHLAHSVALWILVLSPTLVDYPVSTTANEFSDADMENP
jgi:hypothetical protein